MYPRPLGVGPLASENGLIKILSGEVIRIDVRFLADFPKEEREMRHEAEALIC